MKKTDIILQVVENSDVPLSAMEVFEKVNGSVIKNSVTGILSLLSKNGEIVALRKKNLREIVYASIKLSISLLRDHGDLYSFYSPVTRNRKSAGSDGPTEEVQSLPSPEPEEATANAAEEAVANDPKPKKESSSVTFHFPIPNESTGLFENLIAGFSIAKNIEPMKKFVGRCLQVFMEDSPWEFFSRNFIWVKFGASYDRSLRISESYLAHKTQQLYSYWSNSFEDFPKPKVAAPEGKWSKFSYINGVAFAATAILWGLVNHCEEVVGKRLDEDLQAARKDLLEFFKDRFLPTDIIYFYESFFQEILKKRSEEAKPSRPQKAQSSEMKAPISIVGLDESFEDGQKFFVEVISEPDTNIVTARNGKLDINVSFRIHLAPAEHADLENNQLSLWQGSLVEKSAESVDDQKTIYAEPKAEDVEIPSDGKLFRQEELYLEDQNTSSKEDPSLLDALRGMEIENREP